MSNLDKQLDILADYADLVWTATDTQDRNTMDIARTQQEVFESKVWVEEWLEQKPIKPKKYGRPVDPESRNRFSQWLSWKQEQRGRRSYHNSRVYQFANAVEIEGLISTTVEISSERTLRPFAWLKKYDYQDRAPEVWALAVERAGSEDAVTNTVARDALNEYKRERLNVSNPSSLPKAVKERRSAALIKVRGDAIAIRAKFEEMLNLASTSEEARAEVQDLLDWIKGRVTK